MENIDNWEVVTDEQMGAYLSDKRDSINISGFDDGIDARYSYETEVEKKDYRDYFGKIQHHYQDLKRNPLSTFSRNAWNGLLDLPKGLSDAIIGGGEYVAFKALGGIDPEFDKRLAEGANALRAKNAEWFKQYEYASDQKDRQFIADLGRAGGSLVSALGLSFLTRNPSAVAGAFGVSQFGSINKELRERGVDIDRTAAISTGLGIAEGALERVGLHLWFENAATKKISSYLLKQGATEFTQEASQTAVEEVTMKLLGERNTEWWDIAKGVIYSGVIGGIVGVGGGAASIPSTEAFKKQAKDRLVEQGFTEEKAQQLVDDAAYSNEDARRDLLELVNKEADQSTLLNGSYEDDVKAFNEAMQKDIVAEAFDIKQTLKETAIKEGGLDEETAEVASTLVENFTKVMYNETGQTPLEQFEEKGLTIIDERYPSPQDEVIDESELTEEEIARLNEAEAQRQEIDIPFQTDQLRPGDEGYIPYKDGKADINTPEFKKRFGNSKVVDENGKPYSNKQLEKLLNNPQENKEAILDVYENHLKKYNNNLASMVRTIAMIDLGAGYKPTSGEAYNLKIEMKERELSNLKLPKKITLNYLTNILKKNNISVTNTYTANTGSQYITMDLEGTPYENAFADSLVTLSIREHRKHSADYIRPDIDFLVDYDNQWQESLVELADKLDLKGGEITKAKKYVELSKSVYNRGTWNARNDNIYYQRAYAGSRVDYDKPSLEALGTGEGNLAHGWGLYYALNREVAEDYRETFLWNARQAHNLKSMFSTLSVNGTPFLSTYKVEPTKALFDLLTGNSYGKIEKYLDDQIYKWENFKNKGGNDRGITEGYKKLKEDLYNNGMSLITEGQVHEVDLPENPYLLDEDKLINEQSEYVRKAVRDMLNSMPDDYIETNDINDFGGMTGLSLYKELTFVAQRNGIENKTEQKKFASQKLSEFGIKGITYDGEQDGRCFVIFDPKDVKVIQKFYQGRTVRRGSYNPTTQVITLFKEANPSTIIHELGHFFTMKYVKALEETGQQEKLAGFYNWLGINSIDEATTETWEKMARGFETYALEGVAPNASTESVFQRMKQWLVGVYQDLKGKVIPPEEINDDVRAFFDGMLATEQTPVDVSNIKGRTDDLINIINAALKGEEVSIDGLSIKDIKQLIKASNARLPRLPKNLEQAIRAAGGIDIELAKSLGLYDSKIGNRSGFFKEGGAFDREDSLIEFLRDEGFLSAPEAISYEQTAEIQDRAINLLENASQIFRESDLITVQQRESLIEAAQEASRLLQKVDYKEVQQAINTLRDKSVSAVQNDTLKYIKARLNRIEKDYSKVLNNSLRSQRKDIAQKQGDIINYIKEQPISNDHKFRLINEVKKTNSEVTYEKAVDEVKRRAAEYYEQEQKKILTAQIKKEIKKSKPTKVTQQRYDYETNKLFQTLREYNKFTQELASAELEKLINLEDPTNVDLIKMRFLNYKANGMSSSTQLMEKVLDDILQAKRLGSMLKDQADIEAAINREQLKQEVISALEESTADEDKLKTRFANLYRRGFANLYSLINSISSRKIAERYEMETVLNDADVTYYKHTDNLTKKVMAVFGVKSRGDLLNKFADLGEKVDTIYAEDGKRYKISKLEIIDIYNAIKNEKTRANYMANYGEEQVMRFVNMLSQEERLFADLLMEDINSLYPETNKVYVETYGMDLKKVENYWPATSDHISETDLLGDFYRQQETPSFYKERTKGRVTPLPRNAWEKYLKHVNESIYMVKVARKYKELSTTFKSSRVRNLIENKYGKGVYRELIDQINSISLNAKSESLNYVESVFGSMLNNFVVAKIAIAPTVFAGQLTSITNYSEEVNTAEFYKNFAYGLAHPKEVISFMKKHAGNFLETRYKGGYSEALSRVQREAETASRRKYKILSDKTKYNVTNALTSFVRLGDLGSLMFGGYAEIQTNLNAGMKLEDAIKKFEFDTLRSQQSSNAASLSSFQKSTGFSRVLLAFKNTQHQYFRKIVDSIIQYQRGEIDTKQCAKTIMNYAVIQGSLYIIAKNAVKAAMGLGDDDDELTDGLLEQLLVGNLDAIPFLSDIAHYAYKKAAGEYTHGLLSMPGLDDIERAIMKLYKQDKDVYDWVNVIAPLIEGTTAIPVKRYTSMLKKYMEDD